MQVTRPSDRTIVLSRSFPVPRQKLFEALTRSEHVPRWFQPSHIALVAYEPDVRPGGTTRYVFQRPNGRKLEMRHVYKEVEAPKRLVHTETYDFSPLELLVTMLLDETEGKTTLSVTILYRSKQERDADFENVAGSVPDVYQKLEDYLAR